MNEEQLDQRLVERVKPWALPLRMLRHRVAAESQSNISFGQMLKEACEHYGVEYPPPDIEGTILMLVFRWAAAGVPAPVEEMV